MEHGPVIDDSWWFAHSKCWLSIALEMIDLSTAEPRPANKVPEPIVPQLPSFDVHLSYSCGESLRFLTPQAQAAHGGSTSLLECLKLGYPRYPATWSLVARSCSILHTQILELQSTGYPLNIWKISCPVLWSSHEIHNLEKEKHRSAGKWPLPVTFTAPRKASGQDGSGHLAANRRWHRKDHFGVFTLGTCWVLSLKFFKSS